MIPALVGLAGILLVLTAAQGIRMTATTGLEPATPVAAGPTVRRGRPLTRLADALGRRSTRLTRGFYGAERLARVEVLVRAAGRPGGLTTAGYLQRHSGFVVLGLIVGLLMLLNGDPALGLVFAVLFAAWMPLWIRATAHDRRVQLDRELPDFLDVLAVTVNAGVPFRPALARVSSQHTGALGEEVAVTLDEMSLGVGRRAAFTAMRERVGSDGVATFVTALLQAEELGVPLADALRDISGEIRRERAQKVKQQAAKAASKVSLVVTMVIVPASLLLMIAVLVLQNSEMLGQFLG